MGEARGGATVEDGVIDEGLGAGRPEETEAGRAQLQLAFLSEAGRIFARSLEISDALETLARLAVGFLCDVCMIDLVDMDGTTRRVASVHADPARQPLADQLATRFAPRPDRPTPAAVAIQTGVTQFAPSVDEEFLRRTTQGPEHFEVLRELGFHSFISVPLLARDRVVGCLSLISTDTSHQYRQEDVNVAEELAGRAALALDNARLFEAERTARDAAEAAATRQAFLARASETLAASLDPKELLGAIARLAVPILADWCIVDLLDGGEIRQTAATHVDPLREPLVRELRRRYPPDPAVPLPHALWRVLLSGASDLAADITEDDLRARARDRDHLRLLTGVGIRSHMVVAMRARGRILGAISFVFGDSGRTYDGSDLGLAEDLARRAALAVDNAQLYREQVHIARTLQASLLPPSLPNIPGIELAARYRAAGSGTEVGGDFYDAFEVGDGGWVLAIGDVCGKGAEAAAVTGLARHTLRAAALHQPQPSLALTMLNDAVLRELSDDRFCTVCLVRMARAGPGVRAVLCSAGHPLPLVLRADGSVETIGAPGMILGVFPNPRLEDRTVQLAAGDALVLYTDGITERMSEGQVFGSARLAVLLGGLAGRPAQDLAEAVLQAVVEFGSGPPRDDLAILALRVLG